MSSQRRAGVRSITLVKLTSSLAAVSPVIPASSAIRAGRGRPAAAAPSMAPSAFAPQSPSMARSPRSSGSRVSAAASAAPRRRRGGRSASAPAAISAPEATATLMARPGRRSNRLSRLAPPATRPALMTTIGERRPRPARRWRSPVAPMPPSLTAPVVTSPWRRAPRWPRNPRRSPIPPGRRSRRTPPLPRRPAARRRRTGGRPRPRPEPARRAIAPAATAGPSSRVTGSPRWLVRDQVSGPARRPLVQDGVGEPGRCPPAAAPAVRGRDAGAPGAAHFFGLLARRGGRRGRGGRLARPGRGRGARPDGARRRWRAAVAARTCRRPAARQRLDHHALAGHEVGVVDGGHLAGRAARAQHGDRAARPRTRRDARHHGGRAVRGQFLGHGHQELVKRIRAAVRRSGLRGHDHGQRGRAPRAAR